MSSKMKTMLMVLNVVMFITELARGVTLRKECPSGEVHRSCAFFAEYTCWVEADRMERVMPPPKRLAHCRAGCYCKTGLVREFPTGPCIPAARCRNRNLLEMLKNLPTALPFILNHF